MTHIDRIAEFFGVTPNDLLRGLDTDVSLDTLTENEIELVKNYRSLTDEARKIISANVKLLTENLKGGRGLTSETTKYPHS